MDKKYTIKNNIKICDHGVSGEIKVREADWTRSVWQDFIGVEESDSYSSIINITVVSLSRKSVLSTGVVLGNFHCEFLQLGI